MTDFATVASVIASLKTATEIVTFIRQSDTSLEKAELKLKLADLVGALADAKIQMSEVQAQLLEKDALISELSEALELRGEVVRFHDAIYQKGQGGQATGAPHCLSCWGVRNKLRLLVEDYSDRSIHVCTSCGHKYPRRLTPRQAGPSQDEGNA